MKIRLFIFLTSALLSLWCAGEAGLPDWNEAGPAAGAAASLLHTDEPESSTAEAPELGLAPPSPEDIAATVNPEDELPEKFWPDYFGARPKTFLIDPQGLLSPVALRDRLAFLNYHAGDSAIDLYVYVFKGSQELPGEVRAEELVERLFSSGRPAAIVYYYLGSPQRSVLYLSPSLMDAVPTAEQRRAVESSVMQASGKVDPASQLEAFLIQMSIRIYWMERMLKGGAAEPDDPVVYVKPPTAAEKKSAAIAKVQVWLGQMQRFTVPAAAATAVLVVAAGLLVWMRRRSRFLFPVLEVEPRLGGTHAAGVGAVISFASVTRSPAGQREQRPDDLR